LTSAASVTTILSVVLLVMLVLLILVLPGSFFGVVYADHQTRKSLSASKPISDDHPKGEVELIKTKGELGRAETGTDQNVPDLSESAHSA
jgi:cell division protein FtsL